jgi:hypothetical protein
LFDNVAQTVINWTEEQKTDITINMNAAVLDDYSKKSRELSVTHEMRNLMADIKAHTSGEDNDRPKYRVYSAHDTNIGNWLLQFNPSYKWRTSK